MGSKMVWDAETDRKLFLAILKASGVTVDYAAVAQELSTHGATCTPKAISNRVFKLKSMSGVKSTGTKAAKGVKRSLPDEISNQPAATSKKTKALSASNKSQVLTPRPSDDDSDDDGDATAGTEDGGEEAMQFKEEVDAGIKDEFDIDEDELFSNAQ